MNNKLHIIFTHDEGQIQCILPLDILCEGTFFHSKEEMKRQLEQVWEGVNTACPIKGVIEAAPPKFLLKISTCIYSTSFELPFWYGDWDGKFYYEQN